MPLTLQLTPRHEELRQGDERLERHVHVLVEDLKRVAPVTQQHTAQPGTKGAAAEIIIALGTAGVIKAVLEIFRLWLGKDGKRSLQLIAKKHDGQVTSWDVSTEGMPAQAIENALQNYLDRAKETEEQ